MKNQKKIAPLVLLTILVIAVAHPLAVVGAADEALFKMTLVAPGNANMVRRQWGQIIANSFRQIGIDARVVFLGWNPVNQRILTPAREVVGKTWEQGGFDALLLGHTPGLLPEPRQLFYGGDEAFFAPDGQNYYLWNNSQSQLLLDTYITTTNTTIQDQSLKAWQSEYMRDMPCSFLMYQAAPAVVNPRITGLGNPPGGEGWLYFNALPSPEYIDITSGSKDVIYCSTGEITDLIPPLSNSWYDTIIISVIHNGLTQVDMEVTNLNVPALLTSWSSADNGFNWTFNLRHDVLWHDNVAFTADDVEYTLWALMNPATASQFIGVYQSAYGNRVRFTWQNGTSTWLNGTSTPERVGYIWAPDQYTVKATLPVLALGKPYAYFTPYLLSLANNVIPKHIYEKIPLAQWDTSPLNTGQGSITIPGVGVFTGPVGTGPYKWESFNPVTQTVKLSKFEGYWNKTALESAGLFQVENYYIKFIADKTAAIAALKNGEVDILDPNYQMQIDIPTIDPSWGKVLMNDGTGSQELGYNMRHPIWGTGVDTPLGKSNPSKAAEAARYVRTAFDYAIPRQQIIDNLLAGFGEPGATPMLPTQPFYNYSVAARPYNLTKAREYLQLAGYAAAAPTEPEQFVLGNSASVSGVFTDEEGLAVANTEVWLMETTNNATGVDDATKIGQTNTTAQGEYYLTITPSKTGVFYYYLMDPMGAAGSANYLTMLNVTSLSDTLAPTNEKLEGIQNSLNTLTYIAVAALVISIIAGVVAVVLPRMSKKP